MSEYTGSTETILNGRPVRGRTYQRDDGMYESYDLTEAVPGDIITIVKDDGLQNIIKTEGDRGASAMENWTLPAEPERKLGDRAVRLTFLEPNPQGSSFLMPGVVLREGLELGYTDESEANVIKSLGVIAGIAIQTEADVSKRPLIAQSY